MDRIIRRREVEAMVALTERQLRNLESEDKFPKRFLIAPGGQAVGWSLKEVQAWVATRRQLREVTEQPGTAKPGQRIGAHVG